MFAREETWPCNWFQQVENSLDATHVSFVHHWGTVGRFGQHVAATVPKLEYLETDAGIRQIATRSKNSVRVSDWTFPNKNHIVVPGPREGDPWIDVGHWIVPNDDEHSTRIMIYSIPSVSPEADRRIEEYFEEFGDYNPADHHDDLFLHKKVPDDVLLQLTSAQDYVAAVGQGGSSIAAARRLGRSDMGIAFLRWIFWRESRRCARAVPPRTGASSSNPPNSRTRSQKLQTRSRGLSGWWRRQLFAWRSE